MSRKAVNMTSTAGDPPPAPLPERIGRYRIQGSLGIGGMGTVYKAHDPQLDRVVALKVPRFDGPRPERDKRVQRFHREARAAAQVWHPHVCPIYDVGEHDGQPYIVMAYVPGQTLAKHLAAQGRYEDVGQAVALARQVLEALEAVHGCGIVHRDLKPSNILLDAAGRPVLTDFGLARPENDAEHLTSDGLIVGTTSYMAPEQAAGHSEQLGPWTDVYSLGVVLYQMLTGRLPFEGPPLTVLAKIVHEAPPAPSSFRADLAPALEQVLLRALAKEPTGRYQSARQFAEALKGWSAGTPGFEPTMPPATAPVGAPQRAERLDKDAATAGYPSTPALDRRRWFETAGYLLAAAVLLAGCVMLSVLFIGERPSTTLISAPPKATSRRPYATGELLKAAENGEVARVRSLLDQVPVNAKDNYSGETALMKAAANGHISVVKALLEHSLHSGGFPELNEKDNKGETALMKAATNGQEEIVGYMLSPNGSFLGLAELNERDKKGETALMKARERKHEKVVELLKRAGAKE
jgi:tRNA A-37 threonylcarbamoyl transferase component Bud32